MEVDSLSSSPNNHSNVFSQPSGSAASSSATLPFTAQLNHSTSSNFEGETRLDQLDEDGVSALFGSLGFPFYDEQLREHGITGEILIHLDHEALRDVGIHSVGQRLAILRAVWERKVAQNVPVEDGGWRPPEVDFEGAEGAPSAQLLSLLSERDQRILGLEYEVHKLQESLMVLRDDTIRLSQGSPALKQGRQGTMRSPTSAGFPHPLSNASTLPIPSNLSRSRSPSHPAPPPLLALPNSVTQSSSSLNLSSSGLPDSPRSPLDSPRAFNTAQGSAATGEAMLGDSMFTSAAPGAVTPTTPGHPPPDLIPTPGLLSTSGSSSRPPNSRERSGDGKEGSSSSGDANNPYRSFRVTLEDPCYKVLPAALKKYKINDDWRQYALFICHGNTERCLAYDEKPLLLFQRLKEGNANPVFMLRHIKDIKSPIAVASAKHAVRRDKRAVNAGSGLDRLPTVGRDGAPLTMMGGGGLARPTRLHHPPVLLPVGGKDVADDVPPPSPRTEQQPGSCIAIYPYLADREDEFDVEVGDTFVILAKTKGWWVVHRDLPSSAVAPSERKAAWVPAGCLLETSVPPLSLPGAAEHVHAGSSNAASLPIEPQFVVSVSTPGVALMDYDKNGSDELEVRKGQQLRILKRYNHWSYAIKEDGQRGWIPSWFCSRSSSSSTAVAAAAGASRGDATPTTPTISHQQQQQQAGATSLSRSATRQGSVPVLRAGLGTAGEGEDVTEGASGGIVLGGMGKD